MKKIEMKYFNDNCILKFSLFGFEIETEISMIKFY